jgi:hypothetical protein
LDFGNFLIAGLKPFFKPTDTSLQLVPEFAKLLAGKHFLQRNAGGADGVDEIGSP